nr:caspase family protein [Streptomyces sp. NRRL S-118]
MRPPHTAPDGTDSAGDLLALGAHAILIGTPEHVPGSELPALPAVTATLDDLGTILRDTCGLGNRVHHVPADATQGDVVAALEGAVREVDGPILLFYAGHGILGPADELYLATRASRSPDRISEAVPYSTVRNLLTEAPGGSVVILDCCYSGRAKAPGGQAQGPPPFLVTRPGGSYLLSSASWYDLSYAPEGRRHTLFGGRLIELLGEGDPAGQPWLTLDGLHEALERSFQGGPIRPWRQSEGTLGSLRLTRNRAYAEPRPRSEPPADVPCPYPGMEPFGTTQARHFFGREDLVRLLLDVVCDSRRVREAGPTAPVVLVGQSGVGKTSLLTAGLLAGLDHRRAEPSGRAGTPWPPVLLPAPGPHPLKALAEVWSRATGRPADDVHRAMSAGRLPGPLPGRKPIGLLVVDQFEEVFTRCTDAEERSRFIDVLTTPEATGEPPRVVVGLRGDHYGDCLTHPGLARALDHGLFNVRPMDDDALRTAVERPARTAGLTLEPGLTDRLLHDLRHGEGGHGRDAALPFLAHALRETWLRRSGAMLTLAGYEATGGIWHAVTTTTDRLYDELDQTGRNALRELLLRLVHVTDDGVVVRRRVPVGSLLDGLPASRRAATRSVRERLAAARLITVDQDHTQIAHEALLVAWPRLRAWAEEDREHLVQRQRLADSAEQWAEAGRHTDFLLTGIKLDVALELLDGDRLPRAEREFVEASLDADLARRQAQSRLNRRLTWRFRSALMGLCLALVATGYAVRESTEADRQRGVAEQQRAEADRQRDSAVRQRLLGTVRALEAEAENQRTKDPRLSLRLGLAAHRLRPSAESRGAVFGTLAETGYGGSSTGDSDVRNSVLSGDGRTQAGADDDEVVLWDVSDAARRRRLAALSGCTERSQARVAFSTDARTLAAACDGGVVMLWSLADREHPRRTAVLRVEGLQGDPAAVAFSPRGDLLAAAGWGESGNPASHRSLVLWRLSADGVPRRIAVERGVYDNRAVLWSARRAGFRPKRNRLTAAPSPTAREPLCGTSPRPRGRAGWRASTVSRSKRRSARTAGSSPRRAAATGSSCGTSPTRPGRGGRRCGRPTRTSSRPSRSTPPGRSWPWPRSTSRSPCGTSRTRRSRGRRRHCAGTRTRPAPSSSAGGTTPSLPSTIGRSSAGA